MKIDALIFDLDGTAIFNAGDALPTERVIESINKAKEYVKVACATGRTPDGARAVIESLGLTSPCIVSGGSQIVDPFSFLPAWEVLLSKEKIAEIIDVLAEFECAVRGANDPSLVEAKDYIPGSDQPTFYISGVYPAELFKILPKLEIVSDINVHYTPSWQPGKLSTQITHPKASKRKALEEWLKIERVGEINVMAIGDANNDMPLFEIAGLKVAMGNASEELKLAADWVAPSVDEDGLAVAIEKYILHEN